MTALESKPSLSALRYLLLDVVLMFFTAIWALLILGAAKLVWSIPKPLMVSLGAIFLICCAVYWLLGRKSKNAIAISNVVKRAVILLSFWAFLATLFLGGIYRIDRGGWLWSQVTGYDVTLAEDHANQILESPGKFVQNHPDFRLDPQDANRLVLPRGNYEFRETVVIPEGAALVIEPGTNLRFSVGRSLISYSPIIADGTESQPIRFAAIHPWLRWGVVGLFKAEKSVFNYVIFEDCRQALVNGVEFFGGLSLIESDAEIKNSQFINAYGKDAVYVRKGNVFVQNNVFQNSYKDCLDFDGGKGEISSNIFLNCGDEGIDLSANFHIEVFDNQILSPNGGKVSAENNLDEIIASNKIGTMDDK
jgi:hypothetical protein